MRASPLVLVLALFGVATVADAALAPTKASQLVTLNSGGACQIPGHPNAVAYFSRVAADGSAVPFVIPPKQVLVLNEIVVSSTDQIVGDTFFVTVFTGGAAQSNLVAATFITAPAGGNFSVTFAPPTGIAVKAGTSLCVEITDMQHVSSLVATLSIAHGFLASDR